MPINVKCIICGRPGMFGYGVDLLKRIIGTWYCAQHNPR